MKISTLKKMAVMLSLSLLVGFVSAVNNVVTIGSAKGTGLSLYAQHTAEAVDPLTLRAGITFDFKAVTIGGKSWGWTNLTGATPGGADWASQLRYWGGATFNAKTENNLLSRAGTTQTFGSTTKTIPSPVQLSFFTDAGGQSETARITYNVGIANNPVSGDVTVPVVTACTSSAVTETTATLSITGSDDSGDVFYYITGNSGVVSEVSFLPTINLTGLTQLTAYNLTVTPVDFTGNQGTPFAVSFTTGGLVQITSGIAKDIKFVLKSTATKLEYYYEFATPGQKFRDAFLKITPAGGAEFEIKPTLSPDSTYAYGVLDNDARTNSKILTLNCGYMIYKPVLDWAEYVIDNKVITAGTLTGTAIKQQMGGGIRTADAETTVPVLNSVTLTDATSKYIKLNINGSDNSGTVYYTITGAKATVNAFKTGDYYLTDIEPGKVYNLSVKPYDLSNNTAAAKTLTVKTIAARSNVKDSTNCNYNSIVTPTAPNGELTIILQQSGSTLTLGCTTKSLLIPAGNRNRLFNTPTVKIDGTAYPLTLDAANTTATATFNSPIGTKAITPGTSFQVQWSIFWGAPGVVPQGGNFFTGTFTYVVSDNGQLDVTGPSTPILTLTGSSLTWPTCTDDLSGVKSYLVSETGQTPVIIFDLNTTTYSYTMVNPAAVVTVKAVDFIGNYSAIASKNDVGTTNHEVKLNSNVVYPNPATDRINISGEVSEVSLYSLQGQLVRTIRNQNSLDVFAFAKGLYLVRITNKLGINSTSKLEIR